MRSAETQFSNVTSPRHAIQIRALGKDKVLFVDPRRHEMENTVFRSKKMRSSDRKFIAYQQQQALHCILTF
jgi:hypothetical protein